MKKLDLLLVEDNCADADLTLRVIQQKRPDLSMFHIEDGEEALDFIFSAEAQNFPKLILMDLQLPKVSGVEVLKKIKSDLSTRVIPVVMLTSSGHHMDVEECYRSGANGYLIKPLGFQEYIRMVTAALDFWLDANYLPISKLSPE